MKTVLFFATAFFLTLNSVAQEGNMAFFTEQGEKFWVVLNGVRQNEEPQTNVRVTGLNAPGYKMKVIFEDPALAELDKNVMLSPGNEVTYNIKKNNKGEYVVRYLTEAPLAQAKPAPAQKTVVYHEQPAPQKEVTITESTTTTTNPGTGENVSISIGVNANGSGGAMDVNINEGYSQTTTTTTTVSSTSSTPPPAQRPAPGYDGSYGCDYPMSPQEFDQAKNAISSKSFEDTKFSVAKQVTSSKCLLATQVKEVMSLFDYEDTKLDFAKYAYDYTYDIDNYFKVNDAFTFESSIEELDEFLSTKR